MRIDAQRREVFVQFPTLKDLESSLNIMGRKLCDVFVKIYRSNLEQLQSAALKYSQPLPQSNNNNNIQPAINTHGIISISLLLQLFLLFVLMH